MPRGRKKNKILPRLKLKPDTVKSIFFIFFIILAILGIFSFLRQGPIGTDINLFLEKYFGLGAVLVPFLLLLISFLFTKLKTPLREANVFFGFLILFISFLALFKQGQIGLFLWEQATGLLPETMAIIIFFFCLIVGFVVLFDTNIAQIFKSLGKIFQTIKKYTIGDGKQVRSKKSSDSSKEAIFQTDTPSEPISTKANSPLISLFGRKDKKEEIESTTKADMAVAGVAPVLKPDVGTLNSSTHQTWVNPPISIFDDTPGAKADRGDVRKNAQIIEKTLDSFGITARVAEVNNSPSVTQYALEVALGTKLAKILSLSNDLAMALAAPGGQIRVEAPIPGRSLVGIEMPNKSLEVVPIRTMLESEAMKNAKSKISVPLGLDVGGLPKVADIAKMPHVLIAGQTGSGKSICINSWISSILFHASPDEVRFIMVDPKRVELSQYNGIPHLLTPVIVEPEKVVSALKWAVSEMERRYKVFTEVGAKNIESYNNMSGFQSMPYILIVIDELAEIMLFSPAEVEDNICRIAQMARAVGIHLVLATQRPSVNIITGLIKANIPTRIAFAVASMTDSRVILDTPGAEKLLGRGDMLYIPPDLAKPVRIQGCFVSDKEVVRLIEFLKTQRSGEYNDEIIRQPVASPSSASKNIMIEDGEERDAMFDDAIKLIQDTGKASASLLQRRLKLGYARAARVLDQLEKAGIIGPVNGAKPREILIEHRSPSDSDFE